MMKTALFAVVLVLFFATGVITLMGIIQRVDIERKYLNALFSALILELSASVLYLFSETDFFLSPELGKPVQTEVMNILKQYPAINLTEIVELGLNAESMQASVGSLDADRERLNQELAALQNQLVQVEGTLNQRNEQVQWLNKELEARKAATIRLSKLERQFLVRMSDLNTKISEWGASINFRWQPDDKREVALMLQEAFKEIGFMKELELPNDDPLLAHDILLRYQADKQFTEIGFLTPQVVAFIVLDYLSPGLNR